MICNAVGCRRSRKPATATGVQFGVCEKHLSLTPTAESAPVLLGMGRTPARRWAPGASVSGLRSG